MLVYFIIGIILILFGIRAYMANEDNGRGLLENLKDVNTYNILVVAQEPTLSQCSNLFTSNCFTNAQDAHKAFPCPLIEEKVCPEPEIPTLFRTPDANDLEMIQIANMANEELLSPIDNCWKAKHNNSVTNLLMIISNTIESLGDSSLSSEQVKASLYTMYPEDVRPMYLDIILTYITNQDTKLIDRDKLSDLFQGLSGVSLDRCEREFENIEKEILNISTPSEVLDGSVVDMTDLDDVEQ